MQSSYTLGPEIMLAEIMTRNLQFMTQGACKPEEYAQLVCWEADRLAGIEVPALEIPRLWK
ncbi:MAG: hypothetical protein R3B47_13135 [Bacteroidia bacterium]